MVTTSDETDYVDQRRRMVERHLRGRGISDERVLQAMAHVPRHLFVPVSQQPSAYRDRPLPIGLDQTISQPYMVACMTEALRLRPGDRVLEVGTGSGYQTAVLAEMAAEVWSIERHPELAHAAEELLKRLGYVNVHVIVGDGSLGHPEEAPFDAILVTAAAPQVPAALREQLAVHGRMVIPIRADHADDCRSIERLPDRPADESADDAVAETAPRFRETSVVGCTFVPLIGEQGYRG
jgi:protein-L-isoaspartate(D-aspartate) O-methyltransferase